MKKTMGDVKTMEKLYLLTPFPAPNIKEVTVVSIGVIKSNPKYLQIQFLKPVTNEKITDEMLLNANKLMGTKTYETIVIPKSATMCTLGSTPPTVICTTKEELNSWMGIK